VTILSTALILAWPARRREPDRAPSS